MSIIELLQSKGYKVSERRLSIDELVEAFKAGKLEEAWVQVLPLLFHLSANLSTVTL